MPNLIVDINFTFAVLVQILNAEWIKFESYFTHSTTCFWIGIFCLHFVSDFKFVFFKGNSPFLLAYCDLAYAYSDLAHVYCDLDYAYCDLAYAYFDLDYAYFPHKWRTLMKISICQNFLDLFLTAQKWKPHHWKPHKPRTCCI